MSEHMPEERSLEMPTDRSLAEIIAELTWDDLVADGVITIEEIEADLRAKGFDPCEYDYLYD